MYKVWCIYNNTLDYPGKYVVRVWHGNEAEEVPVAVVETLEAAREAIPDGLYRIDRAFGDDPVIVETWV